MGNKYAIVDIETTGGLSKRDRITEIAIVVTDGVKVMDKYETLVNPGISIPPNITRITGITNNMVAEAPRFYEVAKEVVNFTEDCIFVAHNVQFDYSFIQNEFASLGYTFSKRRLCTVKLTRKCFPGLKSYSLGNLIRHFNILVENRHRAMDDALATAVVFHKIMAASSSLITKKFLTTAIEVTKLPEGISQEFIDQLPTQCGVYYMLDSGDEIVYIGKSINIKNRIKQHFGKVDKKTGEMLQKVRKISYELTGSELISLLKEAQEIHTFNPSINRALKKKEYPYCVLYFEDDLGYISIRAKRYTKKLEKCKEILSFSTSLAKAKSVVTNYCHLFTLCKKLNGLEKGEAGTSCFDYSIGNCLGACAGLEEPSSYNERILDFISFNDELEKNNFFIIDKGRSKDEKAIVLIEAGNYLGHGYIATADAYMGIEELKESIEFTKPNRLFNNIVNTYLKKNSNQEIISY